MMLRSESSVVITFSEVSMTISFSLWTIFLSIIALGTLNQNAPWSKAIYAHNMQTKIIGDSLGQPVLSEKRHIFSFEFSLSFEFVCAIISFLSFHKESMTFVYKCVGIRWDVCVSESLFRKYKPSHILHRDFIEWYASFSSQNPYHFHLVRARSLWMFKCRCIMINAGSSISK